MRRVRTIFSAAGERWYLELGRSGVEHAAPDPATIYLAGRLRARACSVQSTSPQMTTGLCATETTIENVTQRVWPVREQYCLVTCTTPGSLTARRKKSRRDQFPFTPPARPMKSVPLRSGEL